MRLDKISIVAIVLGVIFVVFFAYRAHEMPQLPTTTFGRVPIKVEIVTTDAAKELGLGGRASVPDRYGMLFVFTNDGAYGFWMKGMLVPIDIYWLDDSGKVIYEKENVDPSTYPHIFYPSAPARYVLETAAGFGAVNGVGTGSVLDLQNLPGVLK